MAREGSRGERTPRQRGPRGPELAEDLNLDLAALARTGPGPYHVQAELPVEWIAGVLGHTDAVVGRPGKVDVEVTAIGGGSSVLVRGALDAVFEVPCARCLEPAPVDTRTPDGLCVHFVRGLGDAMEDEEGREWSDDEDAESPDQRPFVGTRLDLRPLIEEQILVAYPIRALCARGESCRGLCMHCGANLNEQGAIPGPCLACGAGDAQVPVVAAPADAALEEEEANEEGGSAEPGATPWQAALRGLQISDTAVRRGGRGKKPRN
jgi:uncharacterized metal-binding protein YceD (DUF177 family)